MYMYVQCTYNVTVESKASQYFRSRQCLKKKVELLWIVLESMTIRFLCYVVPGSIDHALVNELISPATIYIHVCTCCNER